MDSFNDLEFNVKNNILKRYSHFIVSVEYYYFTVKLYSWNNHYIEEYYDNDEKKVSMITIADINSLDKYVKNISLSDLGVDLMR